MNIVLELAKKALKKKKKEELSKEYWLELEKKAREEDYNAMSVIPKGKLVKKPTKGEEFKAKYGFSKSLSRSMNKKKLSSLNKEDILKYKELRKKRKKEQKDMMKKKHQESLLFRRSQPKKSKVGKSKNKGKQNSTQTLEVTKKVA